MRTDLEGWSLVNSGHHCFPPLLLGKPLCLMVSVARSGLAWGLKWYPVTCTQRFTRKIKQPAFPRVYGLKAHLQWVAILNSHFLGHLPKPRLETIYACRVAGKTAFPSFFSSFPSECICFSCQQERTLKIFSKGFVISWEARCNTNHSRVQKEELCQNCF